MKITILGANGKVGRVLVEEAIRQGYEVRALVRNRSAAHFPEGVEVMEVDLLHPESLKGALDGAKVIVSAYGPPHGAEADLIVATRNLIDAAKGAQAERLIAIGGAGSLFVAKGVRLMDSGNLPPEWMPIVKAHYEAMQLYIAEKGLQWTLLRPSAFFESGQRTEKFRLGTDDLLVDDSGNSRISFQDFSVALINEIRDGQYIRKAFTVGY